METGDKAAAMKDFHESKQVRQYEPLFTPENLTALKVQNPNNPDFAPGALDFIKNNPQAKREYMLKYGPMMLQLRPPQPPRSLGQNLWEGSPGQAPFIP